MFKITKKGRNNKARTGVLTTPHGVVKTPAYVIVATHGQVKCLTPNDLKKTKTQIVIANAYHLWNKALGINSKLAIRNPLIYKLLKTKIPTMTDSGGFQIFSLGPGSEKKIGKILKYNLAQRIPRYKAGIPVTNRNLEIYSDAANKRQNIKITNNGVYFKIDDKQKFLSPKLSIKLQKKIGADIIFAFDECTSPLDSYEYNKKALERTHKWARVCITTHKNKCQLLFGIVQGGRFRDLRIKSAKFISSLPFNGIGIGGSFGKDGLIKILKWVLPYLPEEKPRHLLGIGSVRDIFRAVENGVDLFDCVIPTREARHGRIYTNNGSYDIRKSKYSKSRMAPEPNCLCPTCKKYDREQIRLYFKNKKSLPKAQRLATIHNVWFFNNLMKQIRNSIEKDSFEYLKSSYLTKAF